MIRRPSSSDQHFRYFVTRQCLASYLVIHSNGFFPLEEPTPSEVSSINGRMLFRRQRFSTFTHFNVNEVLQGVHF